MLGTWELTKTISIYLAVLLWQCGWRVVETGFDNGEWRFWRRTSFFFVTYSWINSWCTHDQGNGPCHHPEMRPSKISNEKEMQMLRSRERKELLAGVVLIVNELYDQRFWTLWQRARGDVLERSIIGLKVAYLRRMRKQSCIRMNRICQWASSSPEHLKSPEHRRWLWPRADVLYTRFNFAIRQTHFYPGNTLKQNIARQVRRDEKDK